MFIKQVLLLGTRASKIVRCSILDTYWFFHKRCTFKTLANDSPHATGSQCSHPTPRAIQILGYSHGEQSSREISCNCPSRRLLFLECRAPNASRCRHHLQYITSRLKKTVWIYFDSTSKDPPEVTSIGRLLSEMETSDTLGKHLSRLCPSLFLVVCSLADLR